MGILNQAKQQQPPAGPPDEPPEGGPPDQQPTEAPDGQPDAGEGAPDSGDSGDPGDQGAQPADAGSTGKPPKGKKGDGGAPAAEAAVEKKFSPEQMNEFHQALKLLYIVLYKNDSTSKSVVDMIQPQDKIGSIGKATVIVLHQLDKKIQLKDSAVKLAITITTVDRLVELAEKAKGIQFSKDEASHLLAAAVHGANTLFHGPQPHPAGGAPGGGPGAPQQPQGGSPGGPGAAPAGGPPPGGAPPQGPPPQAGGANGALAQGAAAQAQAQSAQGMPPPPPPVPGGAQGPPPGGK